MKEAYDAKKYAFAADYIRLYALYHCGGIYLDTDVEMIKPFDDLLNQELMIGYENGKSRKRYVIEAACMGAVKQSPYIKKFLTITMTAIL